MLSEELHHSLLQLLDATITESETRFAAGIERIRTQMAAKGLLRSGHHIRTLDETSSDELGIATRAMLNHVRNVDQAQPSEQVPQRVAMLSDLLLERVKALHGHLTDEVATQVRRIGQDPTELKVHTKADAALSEALATVPAHVRTIVTGTANAARRSTEMTGTTNNNINLAVTDSVIGNIQTGAGSVAGATQTVHRHASEAALQAITDVLATIARAQIPDRDREELLEMMRELQAEVQKPAPNGRRLRSLLGVGADLVAIGPAVQAAWTAVTTHIATLLSQLPTP